MLDLEDAVAPADKEAARERVIAALRDSDRSACSVTREAPEGRGAVSLDGRLIDAASLRMAEGLLRKLEQIEARDAHLPALSGRASA